MQLVPLKVVLFLGGVSDIVLRQRVEVLLCDSERSLETELGVVDA